MLLNRLIFDDRQADRQAGRQADRQTDGQTDRQRRKRLHLGCNSALHIINMSLSQVKHCLYS